MFAAIATVLSKTIDVYIKLNSAESMQRKFGKSMFTVYRQLEHSAAADAVASSQLAFGAWTAVGGDVRLPPFDWRLPL